MNRRFEMAWDTEAAEAATAEAKNELEILLGKLTKEELDGLRKLQAFWKFWYNGHSGAHATGHKALARMFLDRKI
jgi:hypothetical protein